MYSKQRNVKKTEVDTCLCKLNDNVSEEVTAVWESCVRQVLHKNTEVGTKSAPKLMK